MKLGEYLHQFGSALWGDGDEDTTAVSLVRALFSQTLSYQATDDLSTRGLLHRVECIQLGLGLWLATHEACQIGVFLFALQEVGGHERTLDVALRVAMEKA